MALANAAKKAACADTDIGLKILHEGCYFC